MNSHFLIPLFALIFNNLTWAYVLAQKRRNSVNRAYLMLSGLISCWLMQNLILWLPVDVFWYDLLIELNPLFWLPMGFFFLNFSYAYLNKKHDFFYYLMLFLTLVTAVICLTTDLMGTGYVLNPWGPQPLAGPIFLPSVIMVLFLPCLYSLFLMYQSLSKTDDPNRKSQLILIIIGSSIGLFVGFLTDVFMEHALHIKNFLPLGSTGGAILSIFVFFAVIKYRFLAIDIKTIANDLFANVQDGIVILKDENGVIQMNETARKMFNLKGEDLSGIRISAFINNYHFRENYTDFETILLDNKRLEPKVVSLSQSTVRFSNLKVGKILIIRDITAYHQAIIDLRRHRNQLEELIRERTLELTEMNKQLLKEITERKQKESQLRKQEGLLQTAIAGLRESEERYRTLAENAFDLICEASQDGLFMYASPNYQEVMGYDPEELIGQKIFQLIHPDDLQYLSSAFDRAIKNWHSFQNAHRYLHKDGNWLWFESAGKPYRSPNGDIRIVFILRDITNRKKIEEEMIKANKLESIGILAGGLAHDFNNILSILWGNITMAKMYTNLDDKINQRLVKAEMAMIRARELTQQLLIFAKGVEPITKAASIAALVSESICFTLRGSSIHCEFAPSEDLWLVKVDEGQINQVFNNLIINAQQAMPDGGNIKIGAQNMVVTEVEGLPLLDGKYVKLSFTDNGTGIPEENLRKIFDPYFTTKPKGTGLGLATAYSIIKKHNGYISVESKPGTGSTFHLYLPACEINPLPKKTLKNNQFKGFGRVLVMDDETDLREVLAKMLHQIGYEVVTVSEGNEAIQSFKQALKKGSPFLFVIMDLVIQGGMDGKETIKHLLDLDPQIKAIVSSGYSQDPVMSNYSEYGFCEVLKKPYTLEELIETLEIVVNK